MNKKIGFFIVVLIGLVFFGTFSFLFLEDDMTGKEELQISVQTREVKQSSYQEATTFGGFVFSENVIDITSYVGARLENMLVAPGQYVEKGTVLAYLDDDVTRLEQEQAMRLERLSQEQEKKTKSYYDALVEEAKDFLDKAREERDATEEGSEQRKIADEGVDIAESQLESARELREQTKHSTFISSESALYERKIAQEYVQETTITAPVSGFIANVFYEEGEFIKSGSPLIQIVSGEYRASFLVPSSVGNHFHIGDQLRISTKDGVYESGVLREKKMYRDEGNFSVYEIEVAFEGTASLEDGEYVLLDVIIHKDDEVYSTLPREAVVEEYGEYFVYIVDENERAKRIAIESVYEDEHFVWTENKDVLGMPVITSSLSDMYSGAKIVYEDAYEKQ